MCKKKHILSISKITLETIGPQCYSLMKVVNFSSNFNRVFSNYCTKEAQFLGIGPLWLVKNYSVLKKKDLALMPYDWLFYQTHFRAIILIISIILQDTSFDLYQVFKNISWMLKLNLIDQVVYIKKVLIVKKQDLFWDCTDKKVILIKTGFTCIKKGFSKKTVNFFFKENKRKEKLFFQPDFLP